MSMNKKMLLNIELLKEISWIKEDENGRLIYLPPFYDLFEQIRILLSQKVKQEEFQQVYYEEYVFDNKSEYSYFKNNMSCLEIRYKNTNLDLAKHKTLDILALFDRFLNEQLALPSLSGKNLNNQESEFSNYVLINNQYYQVSNVKYRDGNVIAHFNYDIINILLANHLDEFGFILPPKISPVQVCFLMEQNAFAKDIKIVHEYVKTLETQGIRAILDYSSNPMKEKIDLRTKEGIPLLIEGFKSVSNQTNMLIIYICDSLFSLLKIKIDIQFKQMIIQWLLSMIGIIIDYEAYKSLANILIDLMNDKSINIFTQQPTTLLVLIQSCLLYHNEKREEDCIYLLRECYMNNPQVFYTNMLLIFNEKYPQVPIGMKQNFNQNKSLSKSEFREIFIDFFKLFKE